MKRQSENAGVNLSIGCICLMLVIGLPPAKGEGDFLAAKCSAGFPEAMSYLQALISNQGYTVSRVQHVDKGLRSRGYKTGLYRVVFFGKKDEIQEIRTRYPALIPYIPLSITIVEDKEQTSINTIDPITFYQLYKSSEIKKLVDSWQKDIKFIFAEYQRCTL